MSFLHVSASVLLLGFSDNGFSGFAGVVLAVVAGSSATLPGVLVSDSGPGRSVTGFRVLTYPHALYHGSIPRITGKGMDRLRRAFGRARGALKRCSKMVDGAMLGRQRAVLAAVFLGVFSSGGHAAAAEFPVPVNTGRAWHIHKTEWSAADERGYEAFVQQIGRDSCASMAECLGSSANPYYDPDERPLYGDCADMVYTLRAYYAWKNGLPFSHQSVMATKDGSGDARYSSSGNTIAARRDATGSRPVDAIDYISAIRDIVSTAMFRTHPDGGKSKGGGRLYDDFYAVTISRQSLRPGSVAYDIYGHVGLVYDITEDGRILIVASHPDNSVTRTVYGHNFLRADPALGAGLKAWRPVRLEGARKTQAGTYVGGQVVGRANDQLSDFSLEQFVGTKPDPFGDWRKGEFVVRGRTVNYYDYVRRSLAAPDFAYNPVDELRLGMRDLCRAIKDRRVAVRRAIRAGVHKQPAPDRLPPNIYGTYGDWENYSTPSRDARLKVAFIETRRAIERYVGQVRQGKPSVRYEGDDLPGDLWSGYQSENEACSMTYQRSDNTRVALHLNHINDRLFDLSFDPYHCPELRWGARGVELESCPDGPRKRRWYDAQRFLRNQAQRTYNTRMDFTLEELKPPTIAPPEEGGLGVAKPADADIGAYLKALYDDSRAVLIAP